MDLLTGGNLAINMKKSLTSIIFLCIFLYFIGYYNSSYWDPNFDVFKQPFMLWALGIPWIVLFLYFLFGKVLINKEAINHTKVFSSDNIFMSSYMSLMLVGCVGVGMIMIPIIFSFFAIMLGFGN